MPSAYLGWNDTVHIPRDTRFRLHLRFESPGLRRVHCHILEHESQGMMGVLQIR
jgi:FtsP/CotA-like multicopper oxidase with cupredoxin domain